MTDYEILVNAAEMIASNKNHYSCLAIRDAENLLRDAENLPRFHKNYTRLSSEFMDLFAPPESRRQSFWLDVLPFSEKENWRVLALLFFAEVKR